MPNVRVEILSAAGEREPCEISFTQSVPVNMEVRSRPFGTQSFTADNLFETLTKFRLRLEQEGWLLLSNAARKDAYPSRMALEMGGGRMIYVTTPGVQARREDLVDVLGAASPEQVGTVAEQRAHYEAWIASLEAAANEPRHEITEDVRKAARENRNGWVYKIEGTFAPTDPVPPEAVVGAWKVDAEGNVIGEFIPNPKYRGGRPRAGKPKV